MATPLELSTGPGGDGIPVVTAVGEIDMSNAGRFRDVLGSAAPDGAPFVIDLTGVAYLDSAGIHALFEHAARIRLIAPALLVPVLSVAGLTDITSVREPPG